MYPFGRSDKLHLTKIAVEASEKYKLQQLHHIIQ